MPIYFDLLSAVAALGAPAHVVSATPRHVWRLAAWHGLFPQARLWTPKRSPMTVAAPEGGVPVDIRLSFIRRGAARRCLATLLSWNFDKLIIAHVPCVESGAKAFVRRAFRWLA